MGWREVHARERDGNLDRLKWSHPALAERVIAGELSAHAAMIEAGIREPLKRGGTSREYLLRRLKRDNPELAKRVIERELSAHAAAVQAGIIKKPPPEEAGLQRLLDAWGKASIDARVAFLFLTEEEAEAARDRSFVNEIAPPRSRGTGPRPYRKREGEMGVPEIETLVDRGWSVSALARELGVTYRTLSRWRWGETKPNQTQREKVSWLLVESMTGTTDEGGVGALVEGEAAHITEHRHDEE